MKTTTNNSKHNNSSGFIKATITNFTIPKTTKIIPAASTTAMTISSTSGDIINIIINYYLLFKLSKQQQIYCRQEPSVKQLKIAHRITVYRNGKSQTKLKGRDQAKLQCRSVVLKLGGGGIRGISGGGVSGKC